MAGNGSVRVEVSFSAESKVLIERLISTLQQHNPQAQAQDAEGQKAPVKTSGHPYLRPSPTEENDK